MQYSVPGCLPLMFWVRGGKKTFLGVDYARDATHGGASLWEKTGSGILSLANHYPTRWWQYWFYCTTAHDQQKTSSFYVAWCWEAVWDAWREWVSIRMFLKPFWAEMLIFAKTLYLNMKVVHMQVCVICITVMRRKADTVVALILNSELIFL